MYEVITEVTFEAAHQVPGHPKCGQLHGHTWKLVVCVSSAVLGLTSDYPFVIDFGDLKREMENLVPDHKMINEVFPFIPTSENLAEHFYQRLAPWLSSLQGVRAEHSHRLHLEWVEVWEGVKNRARYYKS